MTDSSDFTKLTSLKSVADLGQDYAIPHQNRLSHLSKLLQRQSLPICRFKDHILYALERYSILIIISETGTGKSTQIPQYLYEAGWTQNNRKIVCTQPRRIAALTISHRVADEMGVKVGNEVGYSMRFDSKVSEQTAIKYCTDGVLLRETMSDPLLMKYGVILIDEAHERSLHSDILLGLLKKIKRKREDLRIIITSATLDAIPLKKFFTLKKGSDDCTIMNIQGRQHHVDIFYTMKPVKNFIEKTVETVIKIHKNESFGDILAFLPGAEEIDTVIHMLDEQYPYDDMYFLPLYSTLPAYLQSKVFQPSSPNQRKVILATNIAEASLTIEGIKYVVDSGFVKLNFFNVYNGVDSLITVPISKDSAQQRAGRAGRTENGKCYRLMTESDFLQLSQHTVPAMQRTDITYAILQLKALGIDDVLHFDFLSPPSPEAMIYGLELLFSLSAIDMENRLTLVGEHMAEMSLEPRMSKALLSSLEFGCSEEMLSIAAMCAVDYPFIIQRAKASEESKRRLVDCQSEFASLHGDHITYLNIFKSYEESGRNNSWCDSMCLQSKVMRKAYEIRNQLKLMLNRFIKKLSKKSSSELEEKNTNNKRNFTAMNNMGEYAIASCGDDVNTIIRCLVSGFFSNAAQMSNDGNYKTIRGQALVSLHPNCIFAKFGKPAEWIIFNDITQTKSLQARDVTKVQPLWLLELANHYYSVENFPI